MQVLRSSMNEHLVLLSYTAVYTVSSHVTLAADPQAQLRVSKSYNWNYVAFSACVQFMKFPEFLSFSVTNLSGAGCTVYASTLYTGSSSNSSTPTVLTDIWLYKLCLAK